MLHSLHATLGLKISYSSLIKILITSFFRSEPSFPLSRILCLLTDLHVLVVPPASPRPFPSPLPLQSQQGQPSEHAPHLSNIQRTITHSPPRQPCIFPSHNPSLPKPQSAHTIQRNLPPPAHTIHSHRHTQPLRITSRALCYVDLSSYYIHEPRQSPAFSSPPLSSSIDENQCERIRRGGATWCMEVALALWYDRPYGRVKGLLRTCGDWEMAMDSLQEPRVWLLDHP